MARQWASSRVVVATDFSSRFHHVRLCAITGSANSLSFLQISLAQLICFDKAWSNNYLNGGSTLLASYSCCSSALYIDMKSNLHCTIRAYCVLVLAIYSIFILLILRLQNAYRTSTVVAPLAGAAQ